MTDQSKDLQEWSSSGFAPGQGQQFASDVQSIGALRLFVRALPLWSAQHGAGAVVTVTSNPEMPGVAIEFGFDQPKLSVAAAQNLIERLQETSALMEMEALVEAMRELGVPSEFIDPLVEKADALALKISQDMSDLGLS